MTALIKVERARNMLAECRTVDVAKDIRDKARALESYHRAQKASFESQQIAAELALSAERRMGEILQEMDLHKGGNPSKANGPTGQGREPVKLADLGLTKHESSMAQKLADLAVEEFEARIESLKAKQERLTRSALVSYTSASDHDGDEWGSPPAYVEAARAMMGGIDLDPFSNARAQEVVKAGTFWTKEDDGLAQQWFGKTWANPPYSRGLIDACVDQTVAQLQNVEALCMLVNAATDTAWWQRMIMHMPAVLTDHRIGFLGKDGKPVSGNNRGQSIFVYGVKPSVIVDYLGQFGAVVGAYR